LGLNLLLPRLPLHGPRRIGPRSGDGYLDVDPIMLLHAQIQALWDLRRSVAWIRHQQPDARIGIIGYSLGGFNAALLAAYENDLAFVVAGIPLVDLASILWQHLPPAYRKYFKDQRVGAKVFRQLLSVVSPLIRPCQLPSDRRAIFAGVADRVITPEHPLQLARHWDVDIAWYQGGHLTFRGEDAMRKSIGSMLQRAGWNRQG
jgi:pimeloyl-ACP methyl ester carboxylesterase